MSHNGFHVENRQLGIAKVAYLENFNHQFFGSNTEKPKLIFLHGLMGYAKNWQRIARAFKEDFYILAYDQRGHGKSIKPESGYEPEDYAEDLKLILDELGWEKVYLVGHSMGGRNVLHFAYRWPQRVQRLVIEDIGPDTSEDAVTGIFNILDRAQMPFASKSLAKDHLMKEFSDNLVLANYLYANVEELEDGSANFRFSETAIRQSAELGRAKERWHEVESLQMPTLVIRGEYSQELSLPVFERMKACNSRVTGVEIAQANHWVHYDQAQEFIRVVREFLSAGEN